MIFYPSKKLMISLLHLDKNENTYNSTNKLRFSISTGMFPDILFECNPLIIMKNIKMSEIGDCTKNK